MHGDCVSVVHHRLEGVLEPLLDPVRLQDVDDAQEEKEALAARVARRNAARPEGLRASQTEANRRLDTTIQITIGLWSAGNNIVE